jgi:hypothetical protein
MPSRKSSAKQRKRKPTDEQQRCLAGVWLDDDVRHSSHLWKFTVVGFRQNLVRCQQMRSPGRPLICNYPPEELEVLHRPGLRPTDEVRFRPRDWVIVQSGGGPPMEVLRVDAAGRVKCRGKEVWFDPNSLSATERPTDAPQQAPSPRQPAPEASLTLIRRGKIPVDIGGWGGDVVQTDLPGPDGNPTRVTFVKEGPHRIYTTDLAVIRGQEPLICQRAQCKPPPEYLPDIERQARRWLPMGPDDTVLYRGQQQETECSYPECDCFSEEPPAAEGGTITSPRMSWQDAAQQLERLRQQGLPYTDQRDLADRMGCSVGTINNAIARTESLHPWARKPEGALADGAPRAQSMNEVVADQTAQGREPNPEDDVAYRELIELIERADPQAKAWLLALPRELQLDWVKDPDKYKILADPQTKAWLLALPLEAQLDWANDPDKHPKILGRKP